MGGTVKKPHVGLARGIAALLLVGALGACSSGAKKNALPIPTTTTTSPPVPPTAAQIAQNRAYLLHDGAKLVKFVGLTKPLIGLVNPSPFTCQNLDTKVLPKLGRPSDLLVLATKVKDPQLKYLFDRELRTKKLLLDACSNPQAELAPDPMDYTRKQTAALVARLALFNIDPYKT